MSEVPVSADPVDAPRDRDVALSAAYLRIIGMSQSAAADGAGCGERTLRQWETCSWWPEIQREAEDRWLSGLVGNARRLLLSTMQKADGDANLALKILERRIPALAPAALRAEVTGKDGGPIEYKDATDEELLAQARELGARVTQLTGDGD